MNQYLSAALLKVSLKTRHSVSLSFLSPLQSGVCHRVGHPAGMSRPFPSNQQAKKKTSPVKLDKDPIVCVRGLFSRSCEKWIAIIYTHAEWQFRRVDTLFWPTWGCWRDTFWSTQHTHTHGFRVSVSFFMESLFIGRKRKRYPGGEFIYIFGKAEWSNYKRLLFFLPKDSREI